MSSLTVTSWLLGYYKYKNQNTSFWEKSQIISFLCWISSQSSLSYWEQLKAFSKVVRHHIIWLISFYLLWVSLLLTLIQLFPEHVGLNTYLLNEWIKAQNKIQVTGKKHFYTNYPWMYSNVLRKFKPLKTLIVQHHFPGFKCQFYHF